MTVTGTNLGSGPPDAGCLFGKQKAAVWVQAVEADDKRVAGLWAPPTPPVCAQETHVITLVRLNELEFRSQLNPA